MAMAMGSSGSNLDVPIASGIRAVFEAGFLNDSFSGVKPTDTIFKTLSLQDAIIIANEQSGDGAENGQYHDNAALYVGSNRVGIRSPAVPGADLNVRGNLACTSGNIVMYATGSESDITERPGSNSVVLSHSNIALYQNGRTHAFLDTRGAAHAKALLVNESMSPFLQRAHGAAAFGNSDSRPRSNVRAKIKSASKDGDAIVAIFHVDSNIAINAFDCSREGDAYKIGDYAYQIVKNPEIDWDELLMTVRLMDITQDQSDGDDNPNIDPAFGKAEASGDKILHMEKVASLIRPDHVERETSPPGDFDNALYAFSHDASSTSVDYAPDQNGTLVLTCDDGRFSRALLLRGTTVSVGEDMGVFRVENARVKDTSSSLDEDNTVYEIHLRAVDGRSLESYSGIAYDAFSEAIDQADNSIMPSLHACFIEPEPENIVLTQVQAKFKPDFRVFEIEQDVFTEPLHRFLNNVDQMSGNPVRAIVFSSDPSRTQIPIHASYKDGSKVYLETYPSGESVYTNLGIDIDSESSTDVTCLMSGFPLRVTGVRAMSDLHVEVRGAQFTPAATKRALQRVIYDASRLMSRGEVELIISDAVHSRQWVLCNVNDETNTLMLRRKDGGILEAADLNDEERFIYFTPVVKTRPLRLAYERQPGGMTVNAGLSVSNEKSQDTARACPCPEDVALNVFGNIAVDGSLQIMNDSIDKEWALKMNDKGGLVFGKNAACIMSESNVDFVNDARFGGEVIAHRFKTTSDERIKNDIRSHTEEEGYTDHAFLEDFMRIPVKRYSYVGEGRGAPRRHTGVVAQELARNLTEAVSTTEGYLPLSRDPDYRGVTIIFDSEGKGTIDRSQKTGSEIDIKEGRVLVCSDRTRMHVTRVIRATYGHALESIVAQQEEDGKTVRSTRKEVMFQSCPDMLVVDHFEVLYRTVAALQSLVRTLFPERIET